jgi:hypothetical protein
VRELRFPVLLRSLQPVQAGAKFSDLAVLGLQSSVHSFGPDIHFGAPAAACLPQGSMPVQPLCLEIEAAVDSGESFTHFASQGAYLPLQAFLQIYDQSLEVIHDIFIVHPVYIGGVL